MSLMEMQIGINQLKRYLPILPKLISPLITTANNLQKSIGNINIKNTSASEDGLWQTCMCVCAETEQFHNEKDCTYTLIHVPNQAILHNKSKYYFSFHLLDLTNVSFQLKSGVSLMLSSQFITHRQLCNTRHKDPNDTFFNFESYGNARLYRHIRNYFYRVQKSMK